MKLETLARKDAKDISDSELLKRIAQKNYEAFSEFFFRYDRFVLYLFHKFLRDKALVEDSYQQLFLAVWEKSSNYRGGDVKSYLWGIARNIYKVVVRKNSREYPLSSFPEEEQEKIMSEVSLETDYDALRSLLLKEAEKGIQEFKEKLPKKQRKVFVLRQQGLRFKDISKKLNISQGTCRTMYLRLVTKLKNNLNFDK